METTGLEPAELDEGSPPPLEIFETTTPQLPDAMDDGHPTAAETSPTATTVSQQAVEYEPITPVTGSPTNFDGVMTLDSQPLFTSEALITLISQQESVGPSEETGGETLTLITQQQSVGTSEETGDETLTLITQQQSVGPSEETGDETLTLITQQQSVGPSEETGGETLTLITQQQSVGPSEETGGETLTLITQQQSVGPSEETGGETLTLITQQESVGPSEEAGGETSTQHLQGETAALRPGDEGETGTQAGGETGPPGGAVPGGETGAPSVSGETATQAAEQPRTESSSHGPGGRTDTNPKPSASVPGWKPSASPAGGLKKLEKVGGPLPRRYFPGKRPLDPLKMDMSKPVVMPLSSSQMSLQCLECHIIFSDSKSMERHLKLNHPARYEQCILREALFACYVCDRHFTNSTELMVHQKAHVEKKPFKCPLCSQAFKKSSELTLHKKVHFGEDGYACTDCGKPCKTLTLLKYHRRTHTGETPYVCRECGARFSQTKALQKHQLCHDSEAPQAQEAPQQQQQPKKKAIKYPCSACKAVFRTAKGRCHHMKTKHSASLPPAGENNGLRGAPQSAVPTITPISICQPSLLQMESMGPLQKVDSNMDTELICKLIESMGNVHRVNQVVVLGQVVPTALSGHNPAMPAAQGEATSVNVTSPSGAVVLDPGQDSSLEHTIILEPITPDGQLINPPFARAETAGELMMRSLLDGQDPTPCRGDAADHLALDDPERTVVLELTSVLTPSAEFEQSRPEAASSLIPTKDLEDSHQAGTVPPLIPTTQMEQQDLSVSTCAFMTADTPPHLPGEPRANPEEETLTSDIAVESQADPETQTTLEDSGSQTQATARTDGLKESAPLEEEPHKINGAETSGTAQSESEGTQDHRQSVAEADKDETPHPPPQTEAKRAEQASAPPVNVMSAQELVKVRKRKTQLAGPMYNDYYWLSEQPIKRQRTKKSVLVVKFGPKKKEKRNKGPRKASQACQSSGEEPLVGTSPKRSEKKAALKKRGRKAKKASKLDSQLEQIEEDSRTKTLKRLKDFMEKTDATSPHETTHTPVLTKKKQQKAVQRNLFVEDKMEQISPEESSDTPVVKKKKQQKKALHRELTAEGETDQTTASQEITESPAVKKKRQQKNVQKESTVEGVEDETSPEESTDPPVIKKKKQQKTVPNKDSANDGAMEHIVEEDESTDAPVAKKQQKKTQARKTTEGKTTTKRGPKGKPPQNQEDQEETERSPASAEQQIKQDALLLLRGHKQPQLKVYKLDPSKAACATADPPPQDPPADPQETQEPPDGLAGRTKGKGGRPKKSQKRLTLLASVPVTPPPPPARTPVAKPKTTRKRKNPNVETEGIITSRHALQCKDCGQRFSQLSTLQGHKAVVHAVESPGLTYTNGNVFEGVSSHMHLCPDPQSADGEGGVMTAAVTDWDTEAEPGDAAAPGSVSFPDLNVSPSLPAPGLEGGGHPLAPPGAQGPPQYPAGPQGPPQSLSPPPVALSPGCLKSDQIQTGGSDRRSPPCLTSVSPALPGAAEGLPASQKRRTERGSVGRGDPDEDGSLPGPPTTGPPTGPPEGQGGTAADEDVKEDLLLEVDLVTVGDPNEREEEGVDGSQKESVGGGGGGPSADAGNPGVAPGAGEDEEEKATEMNSTSQTVRQPHVKEEEEETPVEQRTPEPPPSRGAGGRRGGARGRRGGGGGRRGRNGGARRRSLEDGDAARGAEKEQDKLSGECQVVYQQYPLDAAESDMKDEGVETAAAAVVRPDDDEPETTARPRGSSSQPRVHLGTPVTVQPDRTPSKPPSSSSIPPPPPPPSPPRVEQAAEEEQVVFELEPVSTSVDQLQDTEAEPTSRSPALILERFLTARHRNHQDRDSEYEEQVMRMKMEQSGSDPQGVKQENQQSAGPGRHRRWRLEDPEPSAAAADRDPSPGATDLASRQCIFYPVKQEEREELLEDTPTEGDAPRRRDHHSAAEDEYDETPEVEGLEGSGLNGGGSEHMEEEGETDAEWNSAPHLRDFLLQSSDEEDGDLCDLSDLPDPQPEQEAHTMASYYSKDRSSSHDSSSSSHSVSPPSERPPPSTQPIDYFSRYLSRDTWVEMAQCTNRLSKLPSQPTTAREVAQFVGIHIAMGTLKFPSPRLYWQDLTRVPLVAEAMPLSRFLQLCHKLRLASRPPGGAPTSPPAAAGRCNGSVGGLNPARASQQSGEPLDPLWKVQALLGRFQAACRQLSKEQHYGVDQYPVPLTAGGPRDGRLCLHSTVLLGPGGLVHHLELTSDLQDKEATVERLVTSDLQVPQGSMVFLCKQQLSTPAMLERLLASGVHCAGRVGGGAREGQIGDQFVSSDGRLVLRRAQRGFILATAGSGGQPGMAGSGGQPGMAGSGGQPGMAGSGGQPGMAGSGGQPGMAALLQSFQRAQRGARLNRELQGLYRTPLTSPLTSPTCCWPQAVLWYLVDLALVNAWLQYRQEIGDGSEPLSFMSFRLEVSKTLILSPSSSSSSAATDPQDSVPPRRPPPPAPPPPQKAHHQASERSPPNPGPPALQRGSGALPDAATRYDGAGHWPEQLGEGEEGGRCRFGGCERTSRVMCLKCCVFLCISRHHNCFLGFHSRGAS